MNRLLPVTLVGGFLGAGKTSLLHHVISHHRGGNLAVLVENPGALNLDAKALRGLCGVMRRLSDTVLEIPAGPETTQVEWIASQLQDFFRAGRFERVLIEVGGTSNPAWLARHFGLLPEQPKEFASWAELHQIICVVDALEFIRASKVPASKTGLWNFQNEQIERASLIVLNKCDLISEKERETCTKSLHQLNPDARIIETSYGEIPTEICSQTDTPQELGLAMKRRLRPQTEAASPETSSLSSTLYRAHWPFHPERFWNWFNADHPGLLRVKGLIWLATRHLLVGGVSRTRWQNACGGAGIWWAALPREEWPQEPEALQRIQATWREPYGDRRQELVLIGEATQLSSITRQLETCLLNAEEYARPVEKWKTLTDPFPAWDLGED